MTVSITVNGVDVATVTPMICSSLNLDVRINPPPDRADSTQNWRSFRGSGQPRRFDVTNGSVADLGASDS